MSCRLYRPCPFYITPNTCQEYIIRREYNPMYIGSSDCISPSRTVVSDAIKIGLLVNETNTQLMNLYCVPIMPNQNIYRYYAVDKDNFEIPLSPTREVENKDVIDNIPGKIGRWTVILDSISKFVYL